MATTMPSGHHRVPAATFFRWLHRRNLPLPGPLEALRMPVGQLDLWTVGELTEQRAAGSASAEAREQLSPQLAQFLDRLVPLLARARHVVVAMWVDQWSQSMAGVLLDYQEALVLSLDGTDLLLRHCHPHDATGDLVSRLPRLVPTRVPPFSMSPRLLAAIRAADRNTDRAMLRAAERERVSNDAVSMVWRLSHGLTHSQGCIVASAIDAPPHPGASTDWFVGPQGAVLRWVDAHGGRTFEPATKDAITKAVMQSVNTALRT